MKTITNVKIPDNTLGLLYLCDYKNETLKVIKILFFDNPYSALEAFCEIPNPPSQLAMGETKEEFQKELDALHNKMRSKKWLKSLKDVL